MSNTLKICHLYPDLLNLYGDRGNILCMQQRLKWRGITAEVTEVPAGAKADFNDADLIFIGGGQDFEQEVLLSDLKSGKDKELKAAIQDGKTVLAICGGYQMLGNYYETWDGVRCDFIDAIDFYTVGSKERMIGNFAFQCGEASGGSIVVGFENHSGKTYLGEGVQPLGKILAGGGNNGEDGERASAIGTFSAATAMAPSCRRIRPSATSCCRRRCRPDTPVSSWSRWTTVWSWPPTTRSCSGFCPNRNNQKSRMQSKALLRRSFFAVQIPCMPMRFVV